MGERTSYAPGTFSWVDLGTTDAEAAKAFYAALFGWEMVDTEAGDDGTYTLCRLEGADVAALYQMADEQRDQGVPALWTPYITVESVDASAGRVETLGGALPVEPFDLEAQGRMALAQDPAGAVFALWEPGGHIGAARVDDVGCFSWVELATPDTDAARRFYTTLFDWKPDTTDVGVPDPYTVFKVGDRPNAGLTVMTERRGGAPPSWLAYFKVGSCDVAQAIVEARGGRIVAPALELTLGRFVVVEDPQGAAFGLFEGEIES